MNAIPATLLDLLSGADRAVRIQGVELARSMGLGDHPVVRFTPHAVYLPPSEECGWDQFCHPLSRAKTHARTRREAFMALHRTLTRKPWVLVFRDCGALVHQRRYRSREGAEAALTAFQADPRSWSGEDVHTLEFETIGFASTWRRLRPDEVTTTIQRWDEMEER